MKWTRARYRKAHRLARLIGLVDPGRSEAPALLRRYYELWEQYPQRGDPLQVPLHYRPRFCDDDIPF